MADNKTPYENVQSGWQAVVLIGFLLAFCVAMIVVL